MKIKIKARPEFEFAVTMDMVQGLKRLAKQHYDGECQRAAMSISDYGKNMKPGDSRNADHVNGILVIWEHYFDYADKADRGKPIFVQIDADKVDLLLKITAFWVAHNALTPDDRRLALDFHSALAQAWHVAQSTVPLWTKEIETV